jgi:hypothetical protein
MQNPKDGNKQPQTRPVYVIFNELPKANNHRLGENSPDLVTLIT